MVDEAAFVDRKLFMEGLFPILKMANAAMLCLSSPGDESNHYSRMVQAKDKATGEPLFKFIQAKQICDDCLKLPNEEAMNCDHIKNTAPWINHRRSKRFQVLYEDDPVLAMAEYGGVIRSSIMSAFRKSEISEMYDEENNPRVITTATPSMIFITADNNGGGSSHMALTSAYYAANGDFVVSAFSLSFSTAGFIYFSLAFADTPWLRCILFHFVIVAGGGFFFFFTPDG